MKTSLGVKFQYFHKGLFWGLIVASAFVNAGCNKKENINDEYYVKYEVTSSTIYTGGTLKAEISSEKDQKTIFTIATRSPWETVIGPVKKGFGANLVVSEIGSNYGHLKLAAKISVSKNGSPFALKQNDDNTTPRTSVHINYTIDY